MIRYGAVATKMRPMTTQEILVSRLKLLIIMAKANIKGYPMGEHRKDAIIDNCRIVFSKTLHRTSTYTRKHSFESESQTSSPDVKPAEHTFLLRTQLLAVMLSSFAQGKSSGRFRIKSIGDNIEQICKYLSNQFHLENVKFLKVA